MKSSDTKTRVASILDMLLVEVNEDRLRREIDDRIDDAVASLVGTYGPIRSQQAFLNVLGVFVSRLYARGLRASFILTPAQARAKAVALLEETYQGTYHGGLEAALLDATDPDHGDIQFVLACLAGLFKQVERQERVMSVFVKVLSPLSWGQKCALAGHLLERCAPLLPANLSGCRAAQLADELPTLVDMYVSTQNWLEHARGTTRRSPNN